MFQSRLTPSVQAKVEPVHPIVPVSKNPPKKDAEQKKVKEQEERKKQWCEVLKNAYNESIKEVNEQASKGILPTIKGLSKEFFSSLIKKG